MKIKTRILNDLVLHGFKAISAIETVEAGAYHVAVTNGRCNYLCSVNQHKIDKKKFLYKLYVSCDSFVTL